MIDNFTLTSNENISMTITLGELVISESGLDTQLHYYQDLCF